MNMRIKARAVEEENNKLLTKLIIWQNIAAVSLVGNGILALIIVIIIANKI